MYKEVSEKYYMLQPKIINVKPMESSKLYLEYETGEKKIFDVTPYINGSWYGELADKSYFATVHIISGGNGIERENGQDIAPHELYDESIIMLG